MFYVRCFVSLSQQKLWRKEKVQKYRCRQSKTKYNDERLHTFVLYSSQLTVKSPSQLLTLPILNSYAHRDFSVLFPVQPAKQKTNKNLYLKLLVAKHRMLSVTVLH